MLSNFPDIYNATMVHLNKEQNIISTRLFLIAKKSIDTQYLFRSMIKLSDMVYLILSITQALVQLKVPTGHVVLYPHKYVLA